MAEPHAVVQVRPLDPRVAAECERLRSLLPTSVRSRINLARREVNCLAPTDSVWNAEAIARGALRRFFPDLGLMDIDALVAIVMFEICESEEEGLRELLEEMHRSNEARKQTREQLNQTREQARKVRAQLRERYDSLRSNGALHPGVSQVRTSALDVCYPQISPALLPVPIPRPDLTPAQLQATCDELNEHLDTLGVLTEEMRLKIMVLIRRRQRILQILSDILKKLAEGAETVISNLR